MVKLVILLVDDCSGESYKFSMHTQQYHIDWLLSDVLVENNILHFFFHLMMMMMIMRNLSEYQNLFH
mgnify:CR=1 FL=1